MSMDLPDALRDELLVHEHAALGPRTTLGVGGPTTVNLPKLTIHSANLTDAVELNPVPILDFDAHRVTVDLVPFGNATIYLRHKDQPS